MIALLDTKILIARGTPDEPPDLSGFDDLAVSSLTWAELTKGLHTTGQLAMFKERLARLTVLQRIFGAGLPFDDACVTAYDSIIARVTATGGSARAHVVDRMIAATAMAHGCVLVSRDTSGFRGLDDLLTLDVR